MSLEAIFNDYEKYLKNAKMLLKDFLNRRARKEREKAPRNTTRRVMFHTAES